MVVVDLDGHPHKYEHLELMSNIIAKEVNVLKVDVPQVETGRGWQRTNSEVDTQELGTPGGKRSAKGLNTF